MARSRESTDNGVTASTLTQEARVWHLRRCPVFGDLSQSAFESLGVRNRPVAFRRNEILCDPGVESRPYVFTLISGQVKLCSVTPNGKSIIVDVLSGGDVFGPMVTGIGPISALEDSPQALQAVAMDAGMALRFEPDYFRELMERRPTVAINISRFLGMKKQRLELRLCRLLFRSSMGKIAGLLNELAERYGQSQPDGSTRIGLRLTHQDLASLVGIKRETATEALARLESEGFIRYSKRGIDVVDHEGLDRVE